MTMKKRLLLCVLVGAVALAQESRVIEVAGGARTGDPINGPLNYTGNFTATVQKLSLKAAQVTITAPSGVAFSKAKGQRIASFGGGTTATRGRLTATGPTLEYKESTGLGILAGPVSIKITPEKQGDDTVSIQAAKATFDVDTNVSTSESNVRLVNGGQTATASKVVYDEQTDLGCMTDSRSVQLVREPKKAGDPKLVITAKETRVNTKTNTIVALGGVRLEAGDNVTTGEALFYDDTKDTAWVVGDLAKKLEAKNVNKKSGTTISGGTIINYTRRNTVQLQGGLYKIPLDKFVCASSK
jgi:lipopolysaccharide export system protein LptA